MDLIKELTDFLDSQSAGNFEEKSLGDRLRAIPSIFDHFNSKYVESKDVTNELYTAILTKISDTENKTFKKWVTLIIEKNCQIYLNRPVEGVEVEVKEDKKSKNELPDCEGFISQYDVKRPIHPDVDIIPDKQIDYEFLKKLGLEKPE